MITIRKKSEPTSLTHFRASGGKKFEDLDTKTKEDIRASLLSEQGYLCAYCMKRIGRDKNEEGYYKDVKIEHVIPRSETAKSTETEMLELDYSNLVAVCTGSSNGELHCDTSKGNNMITLHPCNKAVEESITYGLKDGFIRSFNELWNNDIKDKDKLNLNHPILRLNRVSAVKGLVKALEKTRKWNRSGLERWIKRLDEDPIKPEYAGIMKFYLKKKLLQK